MNYQAEKRLREFMRELRIDVAQHADLHGAQGGSLLRFVSHATRRDLLKLLEEALPEAGKTG